jgi:iron complex outermembrane recepter protein
MKGSTSYAGARPRLCALSSAVAGALAVSSAGYVQAQEAPKTDKQVDEITVTGSRIVRQDFNANSPIQTVDQQLFEQTSVIGVETVLNKLPQFVPAVTQFTTGDVQQTATNTVGASTVSLRGLGANRNLVLINGRRGMPVNPTMVVDTNSIPSSAIQRVEVISGGASAVYGADAVGGVVNFILKDDYEGASVDIRLGDTQHGGDQTVHIGGLFGVNSADDRGNIMLGIERDTRSKQYTWQRDWWVADRANPATAGGGFAFGSATWFHNEPGANLPANSPANNPNQTIVNQIFSQLPANTISNNLNTARFRVNRDGSVFSGLADPPAATPGAYLWNGPVYNGNQYCPPGITCRGRAGGGDLDGTFSDLPVFVRQPNGAIKENIMYNWASSPLERLSGFANGHFDIADNMRLTGQAMVTRTKTESSLGLAAANINQWGAGVPFGNQLYRGNTNTYFDIPDSLVDVNGNGIADAGDRTNASYTPTGRFGVQCEGAPTAAMPWLDGLPGCTKSEAFPLPADIYRLMISRTRSCAALTGPALAQCNAVLPTLGPAGEDTVWISREPDWMRNALGAGRSTTNTTTTMSFSMGIEGDLPSGNHSWDVTLTTGRSDNTVNQLGSMRLHSYRDVLTFPNFGRNAIFDPNPWETSGFAETAPRCTSGLPVADNRQVSKDCLQIIAPALKNLQEVTQTILEANLTGDLAQMKAGPLQYALGTSYRENGFDYTPDNLSDQQNEIDTIAGLFPTEHSEGKFNVTEIYGELLVPIISDGIKGVEHFNLELGARISDWDMPQMPNLNTYKALIDWGISPRYRIRGGFNRAFRAPNLGELFINRTQIFGGGGATRDWCSTGLSQPGTFSATPATPTTPPSQQNLRTLQICQALMGAQGAAFYYDPARPQDTVGGAGIPNSFGNPALREEQADTWTLGVAMDLLEDWRLTVDWWKIDIANMIALEGGDATYQACVDIAFNPSGSLANSACQRIFRNPTTGGGGIINRSFTNQGRSAFEGVDVQLNWSHQLSGGGSLNLNSSLTKNLHEITQDTPQTPATDWAGWGPPSGIGAACSLQLQCLNYDYRLFTTIGYGRGMWNLSVTHQYWPSLDNQACRTNAASVACLYNSLPAYGLMSASGNIRFNDKYTVSIGLENLLDEEPPCLNSNPTLLPTAAQPFNFPTACTHTGDGSTYDPLGRTYFISMTMDF